MVRTETDKMWVVLGVFFAALVIISICVVYLFWKVYKIGKNMTKLNKKEPKKSNLNVKEVKEPEVVKKSLPTINLPPPQPSGIYEHLTLYASSSTLEASNSQPFPFPPRILNKSFSTFQTSNQLTLSPPVIPPKIIKSKSDQKINKEDDLYCTMNPPKQGNEETAEYLDMSGKHRNRARSESNVLNSRDNIAGLL